MKSYNICPLALGLFHGACCLHKGSFVLQHVSEFHSFFLRLTVHCMYIACFVYPSSVYGHCCCFPIWLWVSSCQEYWIGVHEQFMMNGTLMVTWEGLGWKRVEESHSCLEEVGAVQGRLLSLWSRRCWWGNVQRCWDLRYLPCQCLWSPVSSD